MNIVWIILYIVFIITSLRFFLREFPQEGTPGKLATILCAIIMAPVFGTIEIIKMISKALKKDK